MWMPLPRRWRRGQSSAGRHGGCDAARGHRGMYGRRVGVPVTCHAGARRRKGTAGRGKTRDRCRTRSRTKRMRQEIAGTAEVLATAAGAAWAKRKSGMRTPGQVDDLCRHPGCKEQWSLRAALPRSADVPVRSRRVRAIARSDDEWTTGPGLHSCRGPCGGAHRAHPVPRVHAAPQQCRGVPGAGDATTAASGASTLVASPPPRVGRTLVPEARLPVRSPMPNTGGEHA